MSEMNVQTEKNYMLPYYCVWCIKMKFAAAHADQKI